MTIAQIAERSAKVMILNSFQDPHYRVMTLASAMDDVQKPCVQASKLLYFFISSAYAIVLFNILFCALC